jgi:hypothetical protein
MPTTECYDFLPLDGWVGEGGEEVKNTGGPKDYKDGCHGMRPRTLRMDYNGSHWVSNWEPMMGDSTTTKNLNSGASYDGFVGGMSCEHYEHLEKCRHATCVGGRSNFAAPDPDYQEAHNCYDKASCEGTGKDQCRGYWVEVNKWQPGSSMGNPDMGRNCGDCATNNWTPFREPPVPTPQHDAHLMRLRMGCGGAFQQYTSRDTMISGDYYRNNQLNMFLEVVHCSYSECNKLSVVEGLRPPCPNMFELPATRDGTIDDSGSYSVGINTNDPYFSKGSCKLIYTGRAPFLETDQYCKFPVRGDFKFNDNHPTKAGQTVKFDCDAPPPSIEDHPRVTEIKYCYQVDIDYGTCISTELDPDCYGIHGQCKGVMVNADEKHQCIGTDMGIGHYEWKGAVPAGVWTDAYNPYPYYHDCANWDGIISTPGELCDAQSPCTECCGFNPTHQGERGGTRFGTKPDNYVSCASASDLSSLDTESASTYGIMGSQIPNGKWVNFHGGKSPEVFEVVYAEMVGEDDSIILDVGRLVVKKNSQRACGWAEGTVVSIGMADRNEAETGTYVGTTRDRLSRNPSTDGAARLVGADGMGGASRLQTRLESSIPDGQDRWGVEKDKLSPDYGSGPTDLSEYMEIFVEDPMMLFSRANLLEQDLYRRGARPIFTAYLEEDTVDAVGADRSKEPWPYGDFIWPVGTQSNGRAPLAIANSSQLESIGQNFVREARVGFLPTLSNIDDPNRAVFLSDLPKLETNYHLDADGNPDTTRPDPIYWNDHNISLSIKEVENVYDRDVSFCTNINYSDQSTCEAVGKCEKIDQNGNITVTGTDESDCNDVWIRTAWWRPKFLYTKLITFAEHDLVEGEKIIISGSQSYEATCDEIPGVHKASGGADPMIANVPDLPTGMDMSMIDKVICEESLGGKWNYDVSEIDTLKTGCPPLCELDLLIGKDSCSIQDCGDCFELDEVCLERDTSAANPAWKEKSDIDKDNCKTSETLLRKWREYREVCTRSSFDGEHVVQLLYDDEDEPDKNSIIIVAESRSDIQETWLMDDSEPPHEFVDAGVPRSDSHRRASSNTCIDLPEGECKANQFTSHCYWHTVTEDDGSVSGRCIHQADCASLNSDENGCKVSPFCTHHPAILDDDGEVTTPASCEGFGDSGGEHGGVFMHPVTTYNLQAASEGKLPVVHLGHEVMLGSPKNLYNGEQYISPESDDDGNYGPYFGSAWSRHGGRFRIRVGQEVPLNDCHQGESDTPTMLHWVFTFGDQVCNHYLPIIDADCKDECYRGYGPFTEEMFGASRRSAFPAKALLRVDIHEGSSDRHLLEGPDLGTTYPE